MKTGAGLAHGECFEAARLRGELYVPVIPLWFEKALCSITSLPCRDLSSLWRPTRSVMLEKKLAVRCMTCLDARCRSCLVLIGIYKYISGPPRALPYVFSLPLYLQVCNEMIRGLGDAESDEFSAGQTRQTLARKAHPQCRLRAFSAFRKASILRLGLYDYDTNYRSTWPDSGLSGSFDRLVRRDVDFS